MRSRRGSCKVFGPAVLRGIDATPDSLDKWFALRQATSIGVGKLRAVSTSDQTKLESALPEVRDDGA